MKGSGTEFIFVGDGRDRFMKRLFRGWHFQLRKYADEMFDDLPYWHGERTNIGMLAAAALAIPGTLALQEYGIRRGKEDTNVAGRADLYLYRTSSERSYDFEFKRRYISLRSRKPNILISELQDAAADIRNLPEPLANSRGIALVFVIPYVEGVPSLDKSAPLWNGSVEYISDLSSFGADFAAIHRGPGEIVRHTAKRWKEGYHPGVVGLGKIVRRRG